MNETESDHSEYLLSLSIPMSRLYREAPLELYRRAVSICWLLSVS